MDWEKHTDENIKRETTLLKKEYLDLSDKLIFFGQISCPICKGEFPIKTIPIRIKPISKQATQSKNKELRKAFERAIRSKIAKDRDFFNKTQDLCVSVVFVMGKESRDKDLDNMSKALMDALEGNLFENDSQIAHLNLIKFKHEENEDYIIVNIRKSNFNKHEDVINKKLNHTWAGREMILLEDFL